MKFSGLRPLDPGRGTIDVHVPGFGDVDLRNDCDVVDVVLRLTPSDSTLRLIFESVRHNSKILIEFLDVRLLEGEYEPLGSVLEEDRTLFEDLMYWLNDDAEGFSVETAVAHLVFGCSEVTVTAATM
ncbi:hypothetical protein [Amycolatopsis solani]|uniref:hypothetical protein n=1 Tax=Amycolatopsis solani TaxID=3028615 RepID=UPI0025B115F7|nr:hypothetical protein [Amycolatopsis sp. MEP2-6]